MIAHACMLSCTQRVPGEEELKALSCHTDDAVREWCAVCGFDEECGKEGGDAVPPFSIQV